MKSERVIFYASNHNNKVISKQITLQGMGNITTIEMKDNVWIRAYYIMLPSSVIIGKGSIIVAGSFFTKKKRT